MLPLRTLSLAVLCAGSGLSAHTTPAPQGLFFDDFQHRDVAALSAHGWTIRSAAGHPGIEHARWGPGTVKLVPDPDQPGNRLLRLQARTDGTPEGTFQAQVCHARKYLEGTYAARIRFSDAPVQGADGDVVIQSFYAVSPLRFDFDPEFSEVDWEYLPNGGWGDPRTRLYTITWQTVRLAPWQAHNQAHQEMRSLAGWHTLVVQVMNGRTLHWIDGVQVAQHGGRNYPVVRMSLNFNLWFSPNGIELVSNAPRIYEQDVDWVLHIPGQALDPAQIEAEVRTLRTSEIHAVDSVSAGTPELASTCDF